MQDKIIRIRDLTFAFPGARGFKLSIPHLEIDRGARVMLLGPSGSGKSTLLSLICGVLTPTSGELSVLGSDLKSMSSVRRDRFRAAHIGVIFQQFNLLPYGSLLDNIALPLGFSAERRDRAVASAGSVEADARRLLAALELGHIEPTRRASDLSIGQQQRVAVARALIGAPELVIADEPTSALDANTQQRFLDLMFAQLAETEATLIMVSHDERLADRFDTVISLDDLIRTSTAAPEQEAA